MPRSLDEDPLTLAIAPPPDETYEQRVIREAAEAEAKRISDEIDEQIRKEREAEKKKKKPVKLLLLGQSESGKTATLKNFQLTYARKEWYEERAAWRAVIFLNLVRNVNVIMGHLSSEMDDLPYFPDDSSEDITMVPRPPRALARLKFTEKHKRFRVRLERLISVQHVLESRLGAASLELKSASVNSAAPFEPPAPSNRRALQEFSINSSNGWKSALDRFRTLRHTPSRQENGSGSGNGNGNGNGTGSSNGNSSPVSTTSKHNGKPKNEEEDIVDIIASCRDDIKALWDDDIVRETLSRRKVRLEDAPGFFITDAERIANRDYQPTDDDVIRARLRTLGVQEYRFIFDHVSPFDEKLAEDRRVNRLEDSYLLWRILHAYPLNPPASFAFFSHEPYVRSRRRAVLNKCDLLQAKLQRGVRIRDSVPSFGDRKNDLQTATRYFQQHFKEISRNHSPVQRPFYVHLTSVIDTRSTAVTLGAVEESILREHLRRADLM
ncbi:Guanine nucleotide-binding protein alpha-4 subunit [Psilocybe cubensis]|uniref:Guanine nucleotide-binding protein alpha-4 subunit n=1 Tax=Psilocybe cubensis TaxID=181762 RepID=A0ACB8GNE9_PSICU|nr:Guanine nucleotide-binding protein alpha-4 subunit [Psilocybe cubensis]KAH9477099.1 Guanine nucleotide-binding protein alpha-4 subunit [Psilocybe cubensis]